MKTLLAAAPAQMRIMNILITSLDSSPVERPLVAPSTSGVSVVSTTGVTGSTTGVLVAPSTAGAGTITVVVAGAGVGVGVTTVTVVGGVTMVPTAETVKIPST